MSEVINARDLRAGNVFIRSNNLYQVLEHSFNKTAMRQGIVKCKVKNLRTGSITVEVLTGEKIEKVMLEVFKMNYLYNDGDNCAFMDNTTFETIEINRKKLEYELKFLEEGTTVTINKYGDEILGVSLPDQVICTIAKAEDAIQGNSVTNAQKRAWLASGHELSVPQFIKANEKVIVDTKTGKYVGRS